MIYNVNRKYTAVGRKEMVVFFYCYMISLFIDMLLVTNIIGASTFIYPVRLLLINYLVVFVCALCGIYLRYILVLAIEWIGWVSMGRRWYICICLGIVTLSNPSNNRVLG